MKKLILLSILISIFMCGCSVMVSDKVQEASGMEIYVNDSLQSYKVYNNSEEYLAQNYSGHTELSLYVPIAEMAKNLGYEYGTVEGNRAYIVYGDQRYTLMEFDADKIRCKQYRDEFSTEGFPLPEDARSFDYISIENEPYARISDVQVLLDYTMSYDSNKINIYTSSYYNENVGLKGTSVGKLRNDTLHINDKPYDISIYTNPAISFETDGMHFVNAAEFAALFGGKVKTSQPNFVSVTKADGTSVMLKASRVYDESNDKVTSYTEDVMPYCFIIGDTVYSSITGLCGALNAYVDIYNLVDSVPDGMPVELYTYDFVREDIPATLDELYLYLDTALSENTISMIKSRGITLKTAALLKKEWRELTSWERHLSKTPDSRFLKEIPEEKNAEGETTDIIYYILSGYKKYLSENK